jgi:TonB-dependent receptor
MRSLPALLPRFFGAPCRTGLVFALALGLALTVFSAEARKQAFDVPAGPAADSLKRLANQAGQQVVYPAADLTGVKTAAVKGDYTLREALDRLLVNTGLVATYDEASATFAVSRAPVPNAPRAAQRNPDATAHAAAPASAADEILQLDAYLVTAIGQRYVNQDAIRSKRVATGIYDSISQDDIGKLPDVNIADSFRRIPGISAVNDEDEGRFVLARGMHPSLNYITFEGVAVATHGAFGGGGRNVNLETIPASSVRRLEAFKTFLPNMDGGSIGSYLNLTTRSASDREEMFATISGQAGYFTQRDVPARSHPLSTRAQLMFGRTFGADQRYGLMISAEDFRKSRDQVKIIQDAYSYFNAAGVSTGSPLVGNGFAAPTQFRWYVYNNDLVRLGLNAKFEFNPSDRFRSYLSVYRFRQTDDEDRHGHQVISLAGITGQTATSGTFARAASEVSYTRNDIRRRLDGAHYHAEFAPAPNHRLVADAAWSGTRYRNSTPFIGFRTAASPLLGLTYDSSALIQTYDFTSSGAAAFLGDAANYTLNNFNHRELKTEEYVGNTKLAYGHNTKGEDGPWGVQVGGEFRRLDRRVNDDRFNWTNAAYRLSSANRALAYTPPARAEPFLFLDDRAFLTQFAHGTGAGFALAQPASFELSAEGDFKYVEEISAGYLMATYHIDRLRAAGGLRYESVDATAKTFRRLVAPVPDRFIPIDVPAGYHNLLPSASASYEITKKLWLRAGISKSVGRPDPSDIATLERISADGLSITRGNPDLRPRQSRNYDLSLEYYFPKGEGAISLAAFRKEIADDIFDLRSTETVNAALVTTTQPTNAASSRIQGLEFGLVRNHLPFFRDLLPGLGFNGNVTLYDTQFNYVTTQGVRLSADRMPLQSKWSMNAALSYEWKNRGEVRLAHDYRSEYTSSINPTQPWNSEGWAGYGQFDFTARYRATKKLTIDFSVRNLGNEHRVHLRGLGLSKLHEDVDFGSSFWLGATYRH